MNSDVILKFQMAVGDEHSQIMLPDDVQLLCVQVQRGVPCLWVRTDNDYDKASLRPRKFQWFGTGYQVPKNAAYIGTVQLQGGFLVLHLFEVQGDEL